MMAAERSVERSPYRRCDFEFFERCTEYAIAEVTYGQFDGWTVQYCEQHTQMSIDINDHVKVTRYDQSTA